MTNDEQVEHKILLDENVEITLRIPKVLDVQSFAALMQKTNKLLRLSSDVVPFGEKKTYRKRQENTIPSGKVVRSDAEKKQILDEYNAAEDPAMKKEIMTKYNFKTMNKLYYSMFAWKKEKL